MFGAGQNFSMAAVTGLGGPFNDVCRDLPGSGTQARSLFPGFALPFVVDEEEGLVLHDRTAERSAELIVVERGLALAVSVEEVARIQRVVAEVFEQLRRADRWCRSW